MSVLVVYLTLIIVGFITNVSKIDAQAISELPTDIQTCNATDLNLNECIRGSFQQMLAHLVNGVPELKIPPIDPFILNKTTLHFDTGLAQGSLILPNARLIGLSTTKFEKVNYEPLNGKKVRLQIVSKTPHLYMEGNYKADIKINTLKMTPKGYFNVSMTDVQMFARPEGELYERDGQIYLLLSKFPTRITAMDMRLYADGMFPDPAINTLILDFINKNWRDIYKTLLPDTRKSWEPLLLKVANDILAKLPINLLISNI